MARHEASGVPRAGVIGGSGLYRLDLLADPLERRVETPYGPVTLQVGRCGGVEVAFLARHGAGHALPPHRVPYRANVWALAAWGARWVVATNAVGSLRPELAPGDLVLVDQFIDQTRLRASTFFEGGPEGVVHVDVTEPYCPDLRGAAAAAAEAAGFRVHRGGVYVCTEGPRFETPAEIRAYAAWGGDVVGMTGVPEVVLAREAGLCYASLSLVTNYAAGLAGEPLTADEAFRLMERHRLRLRELLARLLPGLPALPGRCGCAAAGAPRFRQRLEEDGWRVR